MNWRTRVESKRFAIVWLTMIIGAAMCPAMTCAQAETGSDQHAEDIVVRLPDGARAIFAVPINSAENVYEFVRYDRSRTWIERLVPNRWDQLLLFLVGLGGQILFTGRWFLQWIASERAKRSVVPLAYWWASLIGSTILLFYFALRHEPIGILGQATGTFIYVRNLVLIAREQQSTLAFNEQLSASQASRQPVVDASTKR